LLDTLDAVCAAPACRRYLVLDGNLDGPLPIGIDVLHQRGKGLGERIDCALYDVFALSAQPTLLIGMDTPQVSAADLSSAGDRLAAPGADAVLGLAEDGGFWALGLRRWIPGLFSGVEMSRSDTGEQQLRRLREARLRIALLPSMRDVDTAQDASAVAAVAPSGRFAQTLFRLNRYAEASAP
jgi:hypothetical protein